MFKLTSFIRISSLKISSSLPPRFNSTSAASACLPLANKFNKLFIDNEFVNSTSGKSYPIFNPATGEQITLVQDAGLADVNKAVSSANRAFSVDSEWRSLEPSSRGRLLYKLASLMKENMNELAHLETFNCGKTITDSRVDIEACIKCFEYYAGWADKIVGQTLNVDKSYLSYTLHEPMGVCGQILPWNYPILMIGWKLAAPLACGNTVVLKPSELTPLTALFIGALAREAGFPKGVLNILPGDGKVTGNALAMHQDVKKVSFTGSTQVGHLIQEASGKSNLKRVLLELGGKSPFIIFDLDDNGLRKAAAEAANSIFGNQGQSCSASSRIFVQSSIHDKFVQYFKEAADSRLVGDPFDEKTNNGPLISETHLNRVLGYIRAGKEEGAKCIAGGERIGNKGYYIRPTIFIDVKDQMKIAREEIFGPVASVLKFDEINEAIRRANNTEYGLCAGIYSDNLNEIFKAVRSLEAGTVFVNCYDVAFSQGSFGGYKESGIGRVLGEYGLKEYLEVKNVTMRIN